MWAVLERVVDPKMELPTPAPPPPRQRETVKFVVGDKIFNTLLDTGAEMSLVDPSVLTALGITATASTLSFQLADSNTVVASQGLTPEMDVIAIFSGSPLQPQRFAHHFEVMSCQAEYQFLIGMDLIEDTLFPGGIPLLFLP